MLSSGRTGASSSLRRSDAPEPALRRALQYAQRRVCSEQELLAYLARRGVAATAARRALRACRAHGLVDDRACARLWADEWARQGYAWSAIRERLSARGLPAEAISAAARTVGGPSGDAARAQRLVARVRKRRPGAPARLARQLAARGFDAELIERVLGEPSLRFLVDGES